MKLLFLLLTTVLVGLVASDTPTLVPADPFDAFDDAKTLQRGINRFLVVSYNAIINVLCHRVGSQREEVASTYSLAYGVTLQYDLKKRLFGDFQAVTVALASSVPDYLAVELNRIICPDSNLDTLMEVLMTNPKSDISKAGKAYESSYGITLKDDIESKYSGSVQKLLSQLSDGKDNSTFIVAYFVRRDVTKLYNAGEAMNGTDEDVFIDIFANRGHSYLNAVYDAYEAEYGNTMESVIESEFDGDMKNLLLDIIKYGRTKETYLAQRLHNSLDGFGTHELDLMRLIICRCEIDLGDVKVEYERLFENTLLWDVKLDTVGYFQKALVNLIN